MISVDERQSALVMQAHQLKRELDELERQYYSQPKLRITYREIQILNCIAEGNSNKQIADILGISAQTIKNHVSSILCKLNANDRAHAVALAMRNGLITCEEELPRWPSARVSVSNPVA